jgi:hypothetical protein
METRAMVLLFGLLSLAGAVGAALTGEQLTQGRRQVQREEFHHLVGGLGFGPAVNLSGCAFGFDPRLDGSCAEERGPVPGGSCFCPRHAGSLFYYRPLSRGTPLPWESEGDAPSP